MIDRSEVQRRLDALRATLMELDGQAHDLLRLLEIGMTAPNRLQRDTAPKTVDGSGEAEYVSIRELAGRIPYAEQTIRNLMNRGVFRLGEHYVKPRSRIMFRWSKVRDWLDQQAAG